VCVCERERERGREGGREREREGERERETECVCVGVCVKISFCSSWPMCAAGLHFPCAVVKEHAMFLGPQRKHGMQAPKKPFGVICHC
jgi:hypothetical protein